MANFKETEEKMKKVGIPGKDLYELPTSEKSFPDGSQCRFEVSGIERPSTLRAMIDEMEKEEVPIHRIIMSVMGSTLLTEGEMEEYVELARGAELEVIVTPGPSRGEDLGVQFRTEEGIKSGSRIRGCDNLKYLINEIQRAIDLGFRGFLVWDEGVVWLLNQMKEEGDIPENLEIKTSVYAGHANPAGAKVIEDLGATSINPVGDLTLPMLAAIRSVIEIPLDVYVYVPLSFGGINRFYETPEITRIASPCYLKMEPGESENEMYQPWVSEDFLDSLARQKVRWFKTIENLIRENYPDAEISERGTGDLTIPQ